MAKVLPPLTNKQKKFIDEQWDKLKLPDLVRGTFSQPSLDGRCAEAKLVKDYLGDREPIPSLAPKVEDVVLSEEQKELIRNNARQSATELARIIYDNKHLSALSKEARTIHAYRKLLPREETGMDSDDISEEYPSLIHI